MGKLAKRIEREGISFLVSYFPTDFEKFIEIELIEKRKLATTIESLIIRFTYEEGGQMKTKEYTVFEDYPLDYEDQQALQQAIDTFTETILISIAYALSEKKDKVHNLISEYFASKEIEEMEPLEYYVEEIASEEYPVSNIYVVLRYRIKLKDGQQQVITIKIPLVRIRGWYTKEYYIVHYTYPIREALERPQIIE